jgi:thiol-disulfide isomerase/thioredoxin
MRADAALCLLLLTTSSPAAEPTLVPLDDAAAVSAVIDRTGRPLLLHFWALWCPPCVEELPRQVELAHRAREAGADVLFISVDEKAKAGAIRERLAALGAFAAARQAHMDMMVDPGDVARVIDGKWNGSLPATFVLTEGRTAALSVRGEVQGDDGERLLAALRPPKPAKTPPPSKAQPGVSP